MQIDLLLENMCSVDSLDTTEMENMTKELKWVLGGGLSWMLAQAQIRLLTHGLNMW